MPIRILHCHSTFAPGGKETRAVRLMNAFGAAARHSVLSAVPGATGARALIDPRVAVDFPDGPSLAGKPSPGRYLEIARAMRAYDLVLTYNWGAMDAVMAHRLLSRTMALPPLIHHEDGFNADEVVRQKRKRVLFRRAALGAAHALVVPSARLEAIARRDWRQPAARIRRIANGVALGDYAGLPRADAIPGFRRVPGEVVIGTLAGLRAVKNLPLLVRAFARAGGDTRLVIVGEGPERAAIEAEAQACGVAGRVVLPGHLADPARYIGHFDVFALSSDSEQFPISLVEAMAAGLPAVATAVGDVCDMIAPENRRLVVDPHDEAGLAAAIARLVASRDLRHRIGAANRAIAWERYGEAAMIGAYAALYEGALRRPGAFGGIRP